MSMRRHAPRSLPAVAWAVLALSAATAPWGRAAASTFNISPIRVELDRAHRTGVLTLANAEDKPVVVQVRAVAWSQADGTDQLIDTHDLLVSPPVLQIGANSEQIIRVALRGDPDPAREESFRLIFEEVPQAAPQGFTGLQVALRLSVPVFVAPAGPKAAAEVSWETRWLPDGHLEVAATNRGTAHLQIGDFEVNAADVKNAARGVTSKYLLPGSRMSWQLTAAPGVNPGGALEIHGHSDQGEFSAEPANHGS